MLGNTRDINFLSSDKMRFIIELKRGNEPIFHVRNERKIKTAKTVSFKIKTGFSRDFFVILVIHFFGFDKVVRVSLEVTVSIEVGLDPRVGFDIIPVTVPATLPIPKFVILDFK